MSSFEHRGQGEQHVKGSSSQKKRKLAEIWEWLRLDPFTTSKEAFMYSVVNMVSHCPVLGCNGLNTDFISTDSSERILKIYEINGLS